MNNANQTEKQSHKFRKYKLMKQTEQKIAKFLEVFTPKAKFNRFIYCN